MTLAERNPAWRRVVFAADCPPCPDCDEPFCEVCETHYADCECPGPTQDDEYEYKIFAGVLCARPHPEAPE